MGDVLRLVFVNLLESSNSHFAVAQHDELREGGGRHRHLLIRHDKLRHGMAALRGGVGGMSAEESDGNVRQVPVTVLQRSGRALDDELVEGQDVEL